MPRFTVGVRGEWLTVPCRDPSLTVHWLGLKALRRYTKNKSGGVGLTGGLKDTEHIGFSVRTCQGQRTLDHKDRIEDVLEDNAFVELGIDGDFLPQNCIPVSPTALSVGSNSYNAPKDFISLDGNALTPANLVDLGKGRFKIKLTPEAEKKVNDSRELIETFVKEKRVVYGVNTGFGKFARTVIPSNNLKNLQENVIYSSAAGVGAPLSPERTRMLLALRINTLAKGYSGISMETLQKMIDAFNASCLPCVPEKGTVGASGDLAPLSHLALGLMGEGLMWSPKSGWADAKCVLKAYGLTPISPKPKEGLCQINGTQLITSLGAEAVMRAEVIAKQADIIAALTAEVLRETTKVLESDVHGTWPHPGQQETMERLCSLLDPKVYCSEMSGSHESGDPVLGARILPSCPQLHGLTNDSIAFVKNIIFTEMNSATDNPVPLLLTT